MVGILSYDELINLRGLYVLNLSTNHLALTLFLQTKNIALETGVSEFHKLIIHGDMQAVKTFWKSARPYITDKIRASSKILGLIRSFQSHPSILKIKQEAEAY